MINPSYCFGVYTPLKWLLRLVLTWKFTRKPLQNGELLQDLTKDKKILRELFLGRVLTFSFYTTGLLNSKFADPAQQIRIQFFSIFLSRNLSSIGTIRSPSLKSAVIVVISPMYCPCVPGIIANSEPAICL